jgi:hypothetical protein
MKRGPQPKRLFNAAQCRARARLARSIAHVMTDPKLRGRLENQAARLDLRASTLEANGMASPAGPIPC